MLNVMSIKNKVHLVNDGEWIAIWVDNEPIYVSKKEMLKFLTLKNNMNLYELRKIMSAEEHLLNAKS